MTGPIRGTLTHDADFQPDEVHARGHHWHVTEVLSHWKLDASPSGRLADSGVTERWEMRVWGPLPGRSGESGEFVITAETFGNRPGWWLSPRPS